MELNQNCIALSHLNPKPPYSLHSISPSVYRGEKRNIKKINSIDYVSQKEDCSINEYEVELFCGIRVFKKALIKYFAILCTINWQIVLNTKNGLYFKTVSNKQIV